jgi:hypothetical protein
MIFEPICFTRRCKNYTGIISPDGTEKNETYACKAYPKGIPKDIIDGIDLHMTVRDDQKNKVVYEEDDKVKDIAPDGIRVFEKYNHTPFEDDNIRMVEETGEIE